MQQIFTAVLERNAMFAGDFATEPYEAGWAGEAIFFLKVERVQGSNPALVASVQISPDGLTWLDEGTELRAEGPGAVFARVTHFGNWLRLTGQVTGVGAAFGGIIYLCLKG